MDTEPMAGQRRDDAPVERSGRADDAAPPDAVDLLRQALSTPTHWSDRVLARWWPARARAVGVPDVRPRADEPVGAGGPSERLDPAALRAGAAAPVAGSVVAGVAAVALLAGAVGGWVGRGVVGSGAVPPLGAPPGVAADVGAGQDPAASGLPPGTVGPASDPAAPQSTTAEPPRAVHVAGAVARPGLYQVPDAARIADVVQLAGGAAADADLDRVNLAAPVEDGARVFVPRLGQGEPPIPLAPDGAGGAGSGSDGAAGSGAGSGGAGRPGSAGTVKVDLNRADAAALEALPGIGPTLAAAIVEHRTRAGPFRAVDDLLDVAGIGDARLAQLRDLVTVTP